MRNRNNMIKVMLNDKELEHLNRQLEKSDLSKSALLRKLIMGLNINPAPAEEYRKICVLLSNVTINLNQIARHANTNTKSYINQESWMPLSSLYENAGSCFGSCANGNYKNHRYSG